jgi:hypothetical protein
MSRGQKRRPPEAVRGPRPYNSTVEFFFVAIGFWIPGRELLGELAAVVTRLQSPRR